MLISETKIGKWWRECEALKDAIEVACVARIFQSHRRTAFPTVCLPCHLQGHLWKYQTLNLGENAYTYMCVYAPRFPYALQHLIRAHGRRRRNSIAAEAAFASASAYDYCLILTAFIFPPLLPNYTITNQTKS